jgi:hypothetical protein
MPIYVYKCPECNLQKELLQNMGDSALCCTCGCLMKKDYKAMIPANSMHEVWGVDRIGRDVIHYKTFTELEKEAKKRGYEVITGKEAAVKDEFPWTKDD